MSIQLSNYSKGSKASAKVSAKASSKQGKEGKTPGGDPQPGEGNEGGEPENSDSDLFFEGGDSPVSRASMTAAEKQKRKEEREAKRKLNEELKQAKA